MSLELPHPPDSSLRPDKPSTLTFAQKTSHSDGSDADFTLAGDEFECSEAKNRYRLMSEIARGGMGIIIRAYDRLLQRDVAIKLLLKKYRDKPHSQERFLTEALLTSRLQHPCIVPIYDRGETSDQRPFFAMKLISGTSLSSVLRKTSDSDEQQDRSRLLKIFEQVCQTIAYAHSFGILHLDLKPSNIMVGEFGEVHVMDWGLARRYCSEPKDLTRHVTEQSEDAAAIHPVSLGGTPAYMSPEQACGNSVCPKTDVFGLGGLLCEILTGRPPYHGTDSRRVHKRAMMGEIDDAVRGLESCEGEAGLVEIAKQCLAPEMERRPASAQAVARAIGNYLESALEQAESDVARFFELTLDLFCIATLDGFFNRVNSNFPRVLGYSEQQLISQPFLDFVHPDDISDTQNVMANLLEGKPVVQFCNRYRHADGHYVTLEWTAQSIPNENSIFAVARDVSHRILD